MVISNFFKLVISFCSIVNFVTIDSNMKKRNANNVNQSGLNNIAIDLDSPFDVRDFSGNCFNFEEPRVQVCYRCGDYGKSNKPRVEEFVYNNDVLFRSVSSINDEEHFKYWILYKGTGTFIIPDISTPISPNDGNGASYKFYFSKTKGTTFDLSLSLGWEKFKYCSAAFNYDFSSSHSLTSSSSYVFSAVNESTSDLDEGINYRELRVRATYDFYAFRLIEKTTGVWTDQFYYYREVKKICVFLS